jgi:low temperature requirement protein LtrA
MAERTDPSARSDGGRVSTLELFFDLVFVYTITQLTSVVDHHPGPVAAGQAFLVLVVLFWMYGGFIWLSNTAGAEGTARRVTMLAGMAALLVCSLAVPEAFGSDGLVFGIAYLALVVIHATGYLLLASPENRRGFVPIAARNLGGAVLILIAGFTESWLDWVLWSVTAAGYLITLALLGRRRSFDIDAAHFAERHGLVILIVLGESLISVGEAAVGQHVDVRLVIGALCGFLAVAAMWWSYFGGDDERAAHRLGRLDRERRSFNAGVGYDITHILMIAGVIGVAAGTRLGVADLLAPAEPAGAALIGGGAALFLIGSAWFRSALRIAASLSWLVAALVVLAAIPAGLAWGTGQALVVVAAVIGVAVAVERRSVPTGSPRGQHQY